MSGPVKRAGGIVVDTDDQGRYVHTKVCTGCGEDKPLTDYGAYYRTRRGKRTRCVNARCKACKNAAAKAWHQANPGRAYEYELQRRYGITAERYGEMLAAQGGRCAICGSSDPGAGRSRLHVDHDHATGEVRGLTCNRCNLILGKAQDDAGLLREAANYLDGGN